MSAIERCRTVALGGHVARCENDACAHTAIAYNSCRNRHCPKCQGAAARQWLARISQTGQVHRGPESEKIELQQRFVSEPGGDPMQTECSAALFGFAPVAGRAVVAGFDGGRMTSDAGALLLGVTDRAIGLIERFAACFTDRRRAELTEHEVRTLVGQRVFGIALGYEDLIDHDQLRHDPTLAVLAGKLAARRQDCAPLAGKSTLNRLELGGPTMTRYHRIAWDAAKIETLFIDLFLEAHPQPPKQIILDLDATDDPLHGHQEGRFFHGYYDCYCYLPLYMFCGRHLLVAKLRRASLDAADGAVEEVARVVARIRARWPTTRIMLRADSGFAREDLMAWCEANGVDFLFGRAKNERLIAEIKTELDVVAVKSRRTGRMERRFKSFMWMTRRTWSRRRRDKSGAEEKKPPPLLVPPPQEKKKKKNK